MVVARDRTPAADRGSAEAIERAQDGRHTVPPHGPAHEVADRVHACRVVAEALDDGRWTADVEVLDELARIVGSASRWALVVELEGATT